MMKDLLTAQPDRARCGRWLGFCAAAFSLGALMGARGGLATPVTAGFEPAPMLHASFGGLIVGTLLVLLAIPIGPPLYRWLRRTLPLWRREVDESLPFLIFPVRDTDAAAGDANPGPLTNGVGASPAKAPRRAPEPGPRFTERATRRAPAARAVEPAALEPPAPAPGTEDEGGPATDTGTKEAEPAAARKPAAGVDESAADAASPTETGAEDAAAASSPLVQVVGAVPATPVIDTTEDGWAETLQLLPGRLEVVSGTGAGAGQEIRFVRSGPVTEVTLGRADSDQPGYIRIAAPTVSRRHALMRFEKGTWKVANLSKTNPLRLNGEELSGSRARVLSSGDRLEMGDVVLIFHEL